MVNSTTDLSVRYVIIQCLWYIRVYASLSFYSMREPNAHKLYSPKIFLRLSFGDIYAVFVKDESNADPLLVKEQKAKEYICIYG